MEKEIEIKIKEKELDAKIAALNAKQAKLVSLESELKAAKLKFKNYRIATYIILFVGLLFIVFGATMLVQRRKPQAESTALKEQVDEKEQEQVITKEETKQKQPTKRITRKKSLDEPKSEKK